MKKLIAIVLAGAMLFALGGCKKEESPELMLASAAKKLAEVKSMESDMKMSMGMKSGDVSMEIGMKYNMVTFADPLKAKIELTMEMMGQTAELNMFMQEKDGTYTAYSQNADGEWSSKTIEKSDLGQFDTKESMKLYMESGTKFKNEGVEQVNDKDAVKLKGVIPGESLEKAVGSAVENALSSLGTGETKDLLSEIYKDMEDLEVTIWLDKESSYPVKYEIDMTAIMQKLMEKLTSSLSSEESSSASFEFTALKMTIECKNYNAAEEFTIPQEALDAA